MLATFVLLVRFKFSSFLFLFSFYSVRYSYFEEDNVMSLLTNVLSYLCHLTYTRIVMKRVSIHLYALYLEDEILNFLCLLSSMEFEIFLVEKKIKV